MPFKLLKLFGIDIPTRMAELRVELEERLDLVKDSAQQAAETAAVLACLLFVACAAALAAFGVGLTALYSWVSSNYGQFYGFAASGGVLLFVAIIALAVAMSKASSWRDDNASRVAEKKRDFAQTHAERVAAAAEAIQGPAILPSSPALDSSGATAASDLIEPLVWALSTTIKLPSMENPALDELFARFRSSARGITDETVESLVRTVRYGDRPQLFAALGGAVLVGWFLGRHSERKVNVAQAR